MPRRGGGDAAKGGGDDSAAPCGPKRARCDLAAGGKPLLSPQGRQVRIVATPRARPCDAPRGAQGRRRPGACAQPRQRRLPLLQRLQQLGLRPLGVELGERALQHVFHLCAVESSGRMDLSTAVRGNAPQLQPAAWHSANGRFDMPSTFEAKEMGGVSRSVIVQPIDVRVSVKVVSCQDQQAGMGRVRTPASSAGRRAVPALPPPQALPPDCAVLLAPETQSSCNAFTPTFRSSTRSRLRIML